MGRWGSFQEDVEFDPEPLGFVEKRSEEGDFMGWGWGAQQRQRQGVTEKGEREWSCLWPEGPSVQAF